MFATETVSVGSDPIDLLIRVSHGTSLEGRTVLEGAADNVVCRTEPFIGPNGTIVPALAITDG